MGKVLILGVADIRHMTMISLYTEYLKKNNIEYEIICSDRYHDNSIKYEDVKVYKYPMMGNNSSKVIKLWYFLKFRSYAIKKMEENKYDFVITWGENTAVLFADYLKRRGDYCVNIRDTTFSKMPFFFQKLTKAVNNSSFSTWCAQRGLELLPKHDYVIVLNQNRKLLQEAVKNQGLRRKEEAIHVGAIGAIRYIEDTKKLMNAVKNDDRYVLQFFGTGSEELEEYAEILEMKNVEFHGKFYPEETASLLDRIDVMNVYCGDGKNDKNITLGAPIRYGYATYLYKPAIVSPNTRLSEKTKELNIGYTVNNLENFADEFYEWYHGLDFHEFVKGCDSYNKDYEDSFKRFYEVCNRYIKEKVEE